MDFKNITLQYYSHWLGSENILLNKTAGVSFIKSEERNKVQDGYSNRFDILAWVENDRLIVSYGEKATPKISLLQNIISESFSVETVSQAISEIYGHTPSHNIKFVLNKTATPNKTARPLAIEDFDKYLAFFKKVNPGCSSTDWVQEYFEEMVASNICCGVFVGDCLVSCTDAPLMPYMENKVQEIGINTLPDFRGKGYALGSAVACAENIIKSGKCPQWSCSADNIASSRLAQKVGFAKLSDVLALTI